MGHLYCASQTVCLDLVIGLGWSNKQASYDSIEVPAASRVTRGKAPQTSDREGSLNSSQGSNQGAGYILISLRDPT